MITKETYLDKAEDALKALDEATNIFAIAQRNYRLEKGDITEKLRRDGIQVTIIKDIVQGRTADLRMKMVQAEGQVEKCKNYLYLYKQRDRSESNIIKGAM